MEEIKIGEEKVYLKKDWFGYRLVHPIKNPDGSFNWLNLLVGGKRNLITLIIIFILISLLFFGINELISNYQFIAENPCQFCNGFISPNIFSKNIILNISR